MADATRPCEWCGDNPVQTGIGHFRYCGEGCRQESQREQWRKKNSRRLKTTTCQWCGTEFQQQHHRSREHCGRTCRDALRHPVRSDLVPWASCLHCHGWFIAGRRHVHSRTCRHQLTYQRLPPVACTQCGGDVTERRGGARHCSRECYKQSPENRQSQRDSKRRRKSRKRGVARDHYRTGDIFLRDGHRCHICRRKCRRDVSSLHPLAATIDHIVPLAAGGPDTRDNVGTAHRQCNSKKGAHGGGQLRLVG